MPLKISSRALVEQAMAEVTTLRAEEVKARLADPLQAARLQLVDIRDVRELAGGTPVGSVHAPRGMLEFWVDPESPYFKPVFGDECKDYVLFCALGWRSALSTKTLQDMGMRNVAHVEGGFEALKAAGLPLESLEARKAAKGA